MLQHKSDYFNIPLFTFYSITIIFTQSVFQNHFKVQSKGGKDSNDKKNHLNI